MKKVDLWLTDDALARVRDWAAFGLSEALLAERIGIHPSTLRKWKSLYPAFAAAAAPPPVETDDPSPHDGDIEEALRKRALGFQYTETREELGPGGKTVVTHKYAEPDVRALLFWLKNRSPNRWRDHPDVDSLDAIQAISKLVEVNNSAARSALSSSPCFPSHSHPFEEDDSDAL